MIIKPLIKTVEADPVARDARLKALLEGTPPVSQVGTDGVVSRLSNGYLFTNISLAPGRNADVELHGLITDTNKQVLKQSHTAWLAHQGADKLPSSRLLYQLQRTCYLNRQNPSLQTVVDECMTGLRENYQQFFLYTASDIAYSGARGIINHHDGASTPQPVAIPEFTAEDEWWTSLELAPEQPPARLGTVHSLPANAHPVLEQLFGQGYVDVGAVMQYASKPLADGNLPKVCFFTPTAKGRQQWPQRALVLGVYDDGRFGIGAVGGSSRPARGVAVRKIFSP